MKHSNNKDYWLIAKRYNTNQFNVFLIDSIGVNTTPQVSNLGNISNSFGYMTASPNCKKIGVAERLLGYEIYDFDNSNGMISNPEIKSINAALFFSL